MMGPHGGGVMAVMITTKMVGQTMTNLSFKATDSQPIGSKHLTPIEILSEITTDPIAAMLLY